MKEAVDLELLQVRRLIRLRDLAALEQDKGRDLDEIRPAPEKLVVRHYLVDEVRLSVPVIPLGVGHEDLLDQDLSEGLLDRGAIQAVAAQGPRASALAGTAAGEAPPGGRVRELRDPRASFVAEEVLRVEE